MSDEEDDMLDAYLPPEPKRKKRKPIKYKYTALLDESVETLAFLVMNQRRHIKELQQAVAKVDSLTAQYRRAITDLRFELYRTRRERDQLISRESWRNNDGSYR